MESDTPFRITEDHRRHDALSVALEHRASDQMVSEDSEGKGCHFQAKVSAKEPCHPGREVPHLTTRGDSRDHGIKNRAVATRKFR